MSQVSCSVRVKRGRFLSCLFFFFDVKQNKKGVADHDGRATPFLKVLSLTFRHYAHFQMSLMASLSASSSSSDQKPLPFDS